MADESFLTVAEIAAELRCSASTVRRLIAGGKLGALEVAPRTVRVPRDEYQRFVGKAAGSAGVPELGGRG